MPKKKGSLSRYRQSAMGKGGPSLIERVQMSHPRCASAPMASSYFVSYTTVSYTTVFSKPSNEKRSPPVELEVTTGLFVFSMAGLHCVGTWPYRLILDAAGGKYEYARRTAGGGGETAASP